MRHTLRTNKCTDKRTYSQLRKSSFNRLESIRIMAYSPAFFTVQLAYADKLIQRFDADPNKFLFKYTAIGRKLNLEPTLTTQAIRLFAHEKIIFGR